MPASALDAFCYWAADRQIEDQALAMLAKSDHHLTAMLQRGIALEREVAGAPAIHLPDDPAALRDELQASWLAVRDRLAALPLDAIPSSTWDLLSHFIRRRAYAFTCLRRQGKTPPLIIPFAAAATTPANEWPADLPVGHLFPLFLEGHAAVKRFLRHAGQKALGCREAANHIQHAIVWEEFLTTRVSGEAPVGRIDPAWFRVGVDGYADQVRLEDPLAAWGEVARHTRDLLGRVRARDLTGRQAYGDLTFHFTLWYGQCHALHHLTQAEAYCEV